MDRVTNARIENAIIAERQDDGKGDAHIHQKTDTVAIFNQLGNTSVTAFRPRREIVSAGYSNPARIDCDSNINAGGRRQWHHQPVADATPVLVSIAVHLGLKGVFIIGTVAGAPASTERLASSHAYKK